MAVFFNGANCGVAIPVARQDRLQWICDNIKALYSTFSDYDGESLSDILDGLDISNVKRFDGTFYNCKNLKYLDLSTKITAERSLASRLCTGCESLIEAKLWDLINVYNFQQAFNSCSNLQRVYLKNTMNIEDWTNAFNNCEKLEEIYGIDTTEATKLYHTFAGCAKLSDATIKRSNFNLSKVTDATNAFSGVSSITEIDLGELPLVTKTSWLFDACRSLKTIKIKTGQANTTTNYMFRECRVLEDIIGSIDMLNVTKTIQMFDSTKALKNFTLKNIKTNLEIGYLRGYWGDLLTDETLINTAKELWDLTGATSQTLKVSYPSDERFDQIYVKLITPTEEQIAEDQYINNKKPCEVCESTDDGAMTLREYVVSKNWGLTK